MIRKGWSRNKLVTERKEEEEEEEGRSRISNE
jgi:hypothetical protein